MTQSLARNASIRLANMPIEDIYANNFQANPHICVSAVVHIARRYRTPCFILDCLLLARLYEICALLSRPIEYLLNNM